MGEAELMHAADGIHEVTAESLLDQYYRPADDNARSVG